MTQEKNEVSKVLEEGSPDFIDWFGPDIRPGGAWKPENCKARQKVVLLVRSTLPHLQYVVRNPLHINDFVL